MPRAGAPRSRVMIALGVDADALDGLLRRLSSSAMTRRMCRASSSVWPRSSAKRPACCRMPCVRAVRNRLRSIDRAWRAAHPRGSGTRNSSNELAPASGLKSSGTNPPGNLSWVRSSSNAEGARVFRDAWRAWSLVRTRACRVLRGRKFRVFASAKCMSRMSGRFTLAGGLLRCGPRTKTRITCRPSILRRIGGRQEIRRYDSVR